MCARRDGRLPFRQALLLLRAAQECTDVHELIAAETTIRQRIFKVEKLLASMAPDDLESEDLFQVRA